MASSLKYSDLQALVGNLTMAADLAWIATMNDPPLPDRARVRTIVDFVLRELAHNGMLHSNDIPSFWEGLPISEVNIRTGTTP